MISGIINVRCESQEGVEKKYKRHLAAFRRLKRRDAASTLSSSEYTAFQPLLVLYKKRLITGIFIPEG
jgi:hypothetical protein